MFVGNSLGGVLYNMIPHTVAGTHALFTGTNTTPITIRYNLYRA